MLVKLSLHEPVYRICTDLWGRKTSFIHRQDFLSTDGISLTAGFESTNERNTVLDDFAELTSYAEGLSECEAARRSGLGPQIVARSWRCRLRLDNRFSARSANAPAD
jgi:hypothetical protein